jgi:hypothetical protein
MMISEKEISLRNFWKGLKCYKAVPTQKPF